MQPPRPQIHDRPLKGHNEAMSGIESDDDDDAELLRQLKSDRESVELDELNSQRGKESFIGDNDDAGSSSGIVATTLKDGASCVNPQQRIFYAIRTCDSLQAPAIFMARDDCRCYIDQNERNDGLQYEVFDNILTAMEYIDGMSCDQSTSSPSRKTQQARPVSSKNDSTTTIRAQRHGTVKQTTNSANVTTATSDTQRSEY